LFLPHRAKIATSLAADLEEIEFRPRNWFLLLVGSRDIFDAYGVTQLAARLPDELQLVCVGEGGPL
jgi:hypothetical protein